MKQKEEVKGLVPAIADIGILWKCGCGAVVYIDTFGFTKNAWDLGNKHNCFNFRGGVYISREQEKTMGDPELRPANIYHSTKIDSLTNSNKNRQEQVNHPSHYNTGKIEVIDFIEDQELGFNLGNTIKYICRSEHKGNKLLDLEKAEWYLEREINRLKNATGVV